MEDILIQTAQYGHGRHINSNLDLINVFSVNEEVYFTLEKFVDVLKRRRRVSIQFGWIGLKCEKTTFALVQY